MRSTTGGGSGAKVVVIGGGYAGATAAKYVRLFSEQRIQVTLIEPNAQFISCPISNLVLGGHKTMADITTPYDNLEKRHGVKLVRDMVASIDPDKRTVKLASGGELPYDRLIVSPGVDFMYETLPGMAKAGAQRHGAARLESRPANRGPAQAARSHARRRRLRPVASRWRRSAARPAPTSAPAWSPATSRPPSPRARS